MKSSSAKLTCDCRCELAEGPVWHEGCLYWVDITSGKFYRLDHGALSCRELGGKLGVAVPALGDRWLVARDDGFSLFDWTTEKLTHLHDPEAHLTGNRFNDGKCDPQGRFWAGTMSLEGQGDVGALHVLDHPSLPSRKMVEGVTISNGLGWSPDGSVFYYIDSPTRRVDCFDFDGPSGAISNRRTLFEVPEGGGFPDGMTIDANGNLWVALWGGGAVICIDAHSGKEIDRISVPVSQPSSCTFGGDKLDTLYITSAWQGLAPEQRALEPLAGSIFEVQLDVKGPPAHVFGGIC